MKIVVEEDEDDRVPEPVAGWLFHDWLLGSIDRVYPTVPVNDVEEAMAPVPEVMASFTFPVEETLVPAEPEPKVEREPEFVDTGLPIAEPVEVDAIDYKDAEPVVSHEICSSSHQYFLTATQGRSCQGRIRSFGRFAIP